MKLVAKRIEETQTISYGASARNNLKRPADDKVEALEEIVKPVYRRPGALTEADNQKRVTELTELQFKLITKYGAQVKDEGISLASWTLDELDNNQQYISMLRGKSNVVQVFDTQSEAVEKQMDFSDIVADKS